VLFFGIFFIARIFFVART